MHDDPHWSIVHIICYHEKQIEIKLFGYGKVHRKTAKCTSTPVGRVSFIEDCKIKECI